MYKYVLLPCDHVPPPPQKKSDANSGHQNVDVPILRKIQKGEHGNDFFCSILRGMALLAGQIVFFYIKLLSAPRGLEIMV